jgi:hypothetical protein
MSSWPSFADLSSPFLFKNHHLPRFDELYGRQCSSAIGWESVLGSILSLILSQLCLEAAAPFFGALSMRMIYLFTSHDVCFMFGCISQYFLIFFRWL